jgi:WD40 repeat protein
MGFEDGTRTPYSRGSFRQNCICRHQPDGKTIVSGGSNFSEDRGLIKLWDLQTGRIQHTWRNIHTGLISLPLTRMGRLLSVEVTTLSNCGICRRDKKSTRWRDYSSSLIPLLSALMGRLLSVVVVRPLKYGIFREDRKFSHSS